MTIPVMLQRVMPGEHRFSMQKGLPTRKFALLVLAQDSRLHLGHGHTASYEDLHWAGRQSHFRHVVGHSQLAISTHLNLAAPPNLCALSL